MNEIAAVIASILLILAAILHVIWARWSWPFESRRIFAMNLVGLPDGKLPQKFASASLIVASLLATAAYLIVAQADLVFSPFPDWIVLAGTCVVLLVLFSRGNYGFIQSGLKLGNAPNGFRRNDLRIYSPLCIVLSLLIMTVLVG